VTFAACSDSLNTQPNFEENCLDEGTLPEAGTSALITCAGPNGNSLLSKKVRNGDSVIIVSSVALPETIACGIFTTNGSARLQSFTISASGQVDLFLKDTYGSLILLACNDQDCIKDITFVYEISNMGDIPMTVTRFSSTSTNGQTEHILADIRPVILPGFDEDVSRVQTVDTCVSGKYATGTEFYAEPGPCYDEASYSFEIKDGCRLAVDIECKDENGYECRGLQPPIGSCTAGGEILELTFQYAYCACGESNNNQEGTMCNDTASVASGAVDIFCAHVGNGDELLVQPNRVREGDHLVITSPDGSALPAEIMCAIGDGFTIVQTLSFFTQGHALNLENKFGSFELVACAASTGSKLTCEGLLCFQYTISNIGSGAMDLSELVAVYNGLEQDLYNQIPPNKINLLRGEEVMIDDKRIVNICGQQTYTTSVLVDAEPDNGIICQAERSYNFSVSTPSTESPSKSPSGSPSSRPSVSPSSSPSASPTVAPTPRPTYAPSSTPSESPSAPPTVEPPCEFQLQIECIPPFGLPSCNATPPPVEQCQGRPFEMGFIFTGGDCESSFNIQPVGEKFICDDFNGGPPAIPNGESAYIIVTATKDSELLYFEGFVQAGLTRESRFVLSDNGNDFVADQNVMIFKNNDTADPANLLQAMTYHSSCSQNLFLKDRFGGIQLVDWTNEKQGKISCFANQTFELDITVPLDMTGTKARLQTLTVVSNVDPFFYNFTDVVYGEQVSPGETFPLSIPLEIELTSRRTYNLLFTLTALTDTGRLCSATGISSFTAGYQLPPIFPTDFPTPPPRSPLPTIDTAKTPTPRVQACRLDAQIECQTSSGRSCRNIPAPFSTVCNDSGLTAVEFLLTGNGCGDTDRCNGGNLPGPDAYVLVLDDGTTRFSGIVPIGGSFQVAGPFQSDHLSITISSVSGESPGVELQVLESVGIECNGQVGQGLTLLTNFGAVQIAGFANPSQGTESVIESFTMTWTITNSGSLPVLVNHAVATSPFQAGPFNLVDLPTDIDAGVGVEAVTSFTINTADAASSRFEFELSTAGRTPNKYQCYDIAKYEIRVE